MASLETFDSYAGYYARSIVDQVPPGSAFMREFYRVLYAYYQQNGLYTYLESALRETRAMARLNLKPLRNPAWRVTEFYASKLWPGALPGALPMEAEDERVIGAVHQLWEWSNFSAQKQRWARWFAIFGDWFIKVETRGVGADGRVYLRLLRPEYVTDFEVDERGFVTWLRLDVPYLDERGRELTYTETWSKADQLLRRWEGHIRGVDADLAHLPQADDEVPFRQIHGEDFVPIVYQPFRDDGGGRGSGAYSAQLDKIDEANRQATRLAQILFRYNRAVWALVTDGKDAAGKPLPPPQLGETVTVEDDSLMVLPPGSDVKSMVPAIDYVAALSVLQDQVAELTRDLPELAYYDLRDVRELSGRAVRFLLDDLISRVIEARGNAESGLIRAQEMAMTVGKNLGLSDFAALGEWEAGALAHRFLDRPILPPDDKEVAEIVEIYSRSGASVFAAAKAAGMTDEDANQLAQVDMFGLEGLER